MIIDSAEREFELRAHIHSLLSQYVFTHLATDHVIWTQSEVAHCLEACIHPIPMTERTAVALPLEPFEVLSQEWDLPGLDLYEEKWKVTERDVVLYLKQQMVARKARGESSDGYWRDDDDPAYDASLLRRPMSPILSARARLETPRLGKGDFAAKLPQSVEDMARRHPVKQADDIIVHEPLLNVDDVLANKLPVDAETHRSIVELMQTVPGLSRVLKASTNCHVDDFLRSESPPLEYPELEILPVFPRGDRLDPTSTNGHSAQGIFKHMSQLPEAILHPAKMREEDEEDLADAHLVVVDGWQAFRTSSPSTPSLADSTSDVDELFMISSPRSEAICVDKIPMEEHQIPRSKRIGGAHGQATHAARDSLSDFLPALIRPAKELGPRIVHSPKSQPSSPHSATAMSLMGQASVVVEVLDTASTLVLPSSDDSIAFAIKTIEHTCGDGLNNGDPAHFILQEKLDEKDGMLMDVPVMQCPSEHPASGFHLPTRLVDLLVPPLAVMGTKDVVTSEDRRLLRVLKKAKGLQPLQIELSWIPFKYGRTVPTDEEVADVQNDPCPQLAKSIDLAQDEIVSKLAALLDDSMAFASQPTSVEDAPSLSAWLVDEQTSCEASQYPQFEDAPLMMLTRLDRSPLTQFPTPLDSPNTPNDERNPSSSSDISRHGVTGEPEKEPILPLVMTSEDVEPPSKRVRFQDPVILETIEVATFADEYHDYFDDSGVFIQGDDNGGVMTHERNSFGQLANDSEGFEGPTTDGDLFSDVYALQSGDYHAAQTFRGAFDSALSRYDLDALSPSFTNCDIPYDDGQHAGDEGVDADFAFHDPTTSDLTLTSALAHREPVTVSAPLANIPSVRQCAKTVPGSVTMMSARHSLSNFLAICGNSLGAGSDVLDRLDCAAEPVDSTLGTAEALAAPSAPLHKLKEAPLELINDHTLILPAQLSSPNTSHRYMASMELIQKRALVRALTSLWAVDLVERDHMGTDAENVQLILDCDTAVLFVSVETLPSCGHALMTSLTQLSWRFSRLLVVLECYPSSWGYKGDGEFANKHVASVWSPPVVKAVKKLRRDLSIADGIQTKRTATDIVYAFAVTPGEAAAFARMYGDDAASRDGNTAASLGEREWLTLEERDGEYDLCRVDGMNLFAASLLLSQTSLEDFLEMNADERLLGYGDLVGMERMTRFNVEMARRLEAMRLPPSSPIDAFTSLSSDDIGINSNSDSELY